MWIAKAYVYMKNPFCENSQQLKSINYMRKTTPSPIFYSVLNTPLDQCFNLNIQSKLIQDII